MKSTTLRTLLLEALAVLAGILAAFGIDAAWQARSDLEREATYIAALQNEVSANQLIVSEGVNELDEEIPLIQGFYTSVVTSDGAVPPSQILTMVRYMGPRRLELEQVALTDLLNSGGLAYLDRPELRRAIARYERRLAQVTSSRESLRGFFEQELNPYYSAHASMPDMFNLIGNVLRGFEFPEGDFSIDTDAFVRNRTFANLLTNYLYYLELIRGSEVRLLESGDDLLALLAG